MSLWPVASDRYVLCLARAEAKADSATPGPQTGKRPLQRVLAFCILQSCEILNVGTILEMMHVPEGEPTPTRRGRAPDERLQNGSRHVLD